MTTAVYSCKSNENKRLLKWVTVSVIDDSQSDLDSNPLPAFLPTFPAASASKASNRSLLSLIFAALIFQSNLNLPSGSRSHDLKGADLSLSLSFFFTLYTLTLNPCLCFYV